MGLGLAGRRPNDGLFQSRTNSRGTPARDQQSYRNTGILKVIRLMQERGMNYNKPPRSAGREWQKKFLRNSWRRINRYDNDRERERNQAAQAAEQQRQIEQEQAAARAEQEAEWAARQDWARRFYTARDQSYQQAYDYFGDRGVNYGPYFNDIQSAIIRATQSGENNFGSDFSTLFNNIGQQVFDEQQQALRDRSLREATNTFNDAYVMGLVPDTVDDEAIENILNSQYTDAEAAAERARDRNQFTETGYNSAIGALGEQRTLGNSFLSDLGAQAIDAQRASVQEIGEQARAAAANVMLGNNFNIRGYTSRANSSVNNFLAGLEGRLASQAGDVFNIGDALSAGSIAQGQQNLGQDLSGIQGIFTGQEEDEEDQNRQTPVNSIF